jgi:hypothetical protein
VELQEEANLFLTERNPTLADLLQDENWLCNLPCLIDASQKFSALSRTSLLCYNPNILLFHDKIIVLFGKKVVNGKIDIFPWENEFIEEN